MKFFELEPSDISNLNDADLREMVARLCEAELLSQKIQPSCVFWGGAQEAADGGLDVRIVSTVPLSSPSFITRENTGFQVKKSSMGKAACTKEMLENGQLKTVINDLLDKQGAYIIVSGKDDCSDKMLSERIQGMKSALESLPNSDNLLLDFYGRDRLNMWLRQFPSVVLWVRIRLAKPLSGWLPFGNWTTVPTVQKDEFLLDDHPCVIDVNSNSKKPLSIADGIELVRERLVRAGSVVRITGLSGVGKTRFAQALFEDGVGEKPLPYTNVIYADLGNELSPTASQLISYLIANNFSTYVVLDNCPPDTHRRLQGQVSSNNAKLSLLTIEYDISDDHPEETEVIHIEPSSLPIISKLIQKRYPNLGQVNANKIAEFSGGNARVAIALANRVKSDETLTNFSDEELFQKLFNQRKGTTESLLESAEVLSLVYSFNVATKEFNDELSVLASIGGLERNKLYRNHAELLRRQLMQQRGNWRALLPHALANRLARRALQNISPEQINAELLKNDNLRLFKSCAHRLGYLHDFGPARQLVNSWMSDDGPFHDIANCNVELLTALKYIAPIAPDAVLDVIDNASNTPNFFLRKTEHFSVFVRLLKKIAYYDCYFDRAAELMLSFTETEKPEENNNSVVSQLASLFSLYLSGTHAPPKQRHLFLERILNCSNVRYLKIAQEIFQSAFQTSGWSSFDDFDFGARSRDFGWEPQTNQDKSEWYLGFIELLVVLLDSEDEFRTAWARAIFTKHFMTLWCDAGCFERLEDIICKYAADGQWPEMWMSIKRTIHYKGSRHTPELLLKIQKLERVTAPIDLYSEIETYVLINTWEHSEIKGGDYRRNAEEIRKKIEKLGGLVVTKPKLLESLAPKLLSKQVDALRIFGKGLAIGSSDQKETFDYLVQLMQKQELELIQPYLFQGFVSGVYACNPELSKILQESVLTIPQIKKYFIEILCATPISSWAVRRLIEIAQTTEFEAWKFQQISYGEIHKDILDDDLSILLSTINNLEGGVFAVMEILSMRFFTENSCNYIPSNRLRAVGRETILKLLLMHRDVINQKTPFNLERICEVCLSESATENDISNVVDMLCNGVETYRLYSIDLEGMIIFLVKNHTESVLDRVFLKSDNSEQLVQFLFKDRATSSNSVLNIAPIERILNWCNGNQDRVKKVAGAVSAYLSSDNEFPSLNNSEDMTLSQHIIKLLDVAEDKVSIVEIIFDNVNPFSWTGSLAEILATRAEALSNLLKYDSKEVREIATIKLSFLNEKICKIRKREAIRYSQIEQTFE